MKLKDFLTESYFDGLYHLSISSNLTKENLKLKSSHLLPDKPSDGFWIAKGLSWLNWSKNNEFAVGEYIYKVEINSKAKILDLKNKKDFTVFLIPKGKKNQKFIKKAQESFPIDRIDFDKVKKEFDGVRAYNIFGGSSWDVPSVAIWNKNAIQSIKLLGKVKDVIKKKNEKP